MVQKRASKSSLSAQLCIFASYLSKLGCLNSTPITFHKILVNIRYLISLQGHFVQVQHLLSGLNYGNPYYYTNFQSSGMDKK